MKYPKSIQHLIDKFTKLPTVGPKTAERYVFYLLRQPGENIQKLAQAIAELKEKITICQTCFAVMETNPCHICKDDKRNNSTICVVANTRDLLAIEQAKEFTGIYHVLGGLINAIDDVKPEHLKIKQLISKIKQAKTKEIILALNPNMEGETTALFLTKLIKPLNIKITRIAQGLPTGAYLEYADESTLANALKYRNEL